MRKLEEHNRFLLKTGNSRIAKQTNQSDNDIDINSAVVERMAFVYNKELFLKAWYSKRDRNAANEHFDNGDIYANSLANKRLCRGSYTCRLFQFASVARAELRTFISKLFIWY